MHERRPPTPAGSWLSEENIMKIRQIQDSRNQHIVAIDSGVELRCYFKDSSAHTAGAVADTLRRDAARFGQDVGEQANFATLPLIASRKAKSGRTIYDVAE
jgi:hypothetical protein